MDTTINRVFKERAQRYGSRIAVEKKLNGKWISASWEEYYAAAAYAGMGLRSLGIDSGDRVAILSENRLEWIYSDMGALGIGACVIPVYTTLTAEEVGYILNDSGTKVIILENAMQLKKILEILDTCPFLKHIIVMNDEDETLPTVMTFDKLIDLGKHEYQQDPSLFEKLSAGVEPEQIATIVYTSGTTGHPKGVMLSHGNIISVIKSLHAVEPHYATDEDQTVPFLPLSHVFERVAGHWYGMYVGITASYAQSIETLLDDFLEKKPTIILAVPRVCEKVYQRIIEKVNAAPAFQKLVFYWGHRVGNKISACREIKQQPSILLRWKYKIAYKLVFRNLMDALGGRVRWMTASGASTGEKIIRFFNGAGIMVIQGYGMTECCAPATMQNVAHYKIGSTGEPIPGMDIKIAVDGEILLKGDNVFKGYWNMEKETGEVFTHDGYLKSGDLGCFDDNGFLYITGRKKDLIITSGGKNIAPQKIEDLFKSNPLFSQFIVVGEGRKYLSALCNINIELAQKIAAEKKIPFEEPEELLRNREFLEIIGKHVDELNLHLARYETIKKIRVVVDEFSQETGELTPSLKVKRNIVHDKYKDLIDSMYETELQKTAILSSYK
ncbi:MAG: long-chain fatty acid--CoA ligase [bacterium]|nr:long-chain fatty acid--CoA ligase [bacterium]